MYESYQKKKVLKKLYDENWKLFLNTSNCGFCVLQMEYLKEKSEYVDIIHCDDKKNIRECSNLQSLPSWVNGRKIVPGARLSIFSLQSLL